MKCDDCVLGVRSGGLLGLMFIKRSSARMSEGNFTVFEHCPRCGYDNSVIAPYEPISCFFNLTYSSYLVIPRLFLEAMPETWQAAFVTMLEEITETLDISDDYTHEYHVNYRKDKRYAKDQYRDYRRGHIALRQGEDKRPY